jgi:hypothetical protein
LKFAFLLAQALLEAFDIHSSDDNPAGTRQRRCGKGVLEEEQAGPRFHSRGFLRILRG